MVNRKKPRAFCAYCGTLLTRPDTIYCSNQCQQDRQYTNSVERWLAGSVEGHYKSGSVKPFVRRYLFEKYGGNCVECGWHGINPITGLCPLEIHHIDGNWSNTTESNLTLLCPNCHALTDNHGALNIGRGRPYKRVFV